MHRLRGIEEALPGRLGDLLRERCRTAAAVERVISVPERAPVLIVGAADGPDLEAVVAHDCGGSDACGAVRGGSSCRTIYQAPARPVNRPKGAVRVRRLHAALAHSEETQHGTQRRESRLFRTVSGSRSATARTAATSRRPSNGRTRRAIRAASPWSSRTRRAQGDLQTLGGLQRAACLSEAWARTAARPRPGAPLGMAVNDFGNSGYDGPQPPHGHGTHHYHFRLLALDVPELNLARLVRASRTCLDAAQPHVIAQAETVGTFQS